MNDFLDNLGKTLNEAVRMSIKVSGDAVELTKTSLNIKFDEIKRDSFFKEIGRIVYANYKENADSAAADIADFCKCVDEIEISIDEQKVRAAKIKNKKFCVNCGVQLLKSVNYCYSCGARQPIIAEEPEAEECGGCCEEPEAPECCEDSEANAGGGCDGDSCEM